MRNIRKKVIWTLIFAFVYAYGLYAMVVSCQALYDSLMSGKTKESLANFVNCLYGVAIFVLAYRVTVQVLNDMRGD